MLYKPPKAKRYITIGVIAILLAVLAIVAIPIIYKNKPIQTPPANISKISQQQKIQKDMNEAAKRLKDQDIPEQQIKEDMTKASEELKKIPAPSQEDMQQASKKLNQSVK